MSTIRIEDLPPIMQQRVRDIIAAEDARKNQQPAPVQPKQPPPRTAKLPNSTESAYRTDCLAGKDARFEAITFHMANGHKYTPDWTVFVNGAPTECHEVKGSYALHSQQRARLAFDQAAIEFPGLKWFWATRKDGNWKQEAIHPPNWKKEIIP